MADDEDDLLLMKFLDSEASDKAAPQVFDERPSTSKKSFKEEFGFLDERSDCSKAKALDSLIKNESQSKPVLSFSELGSGQAIIVNPNQKGNPLLELIKGVPWKFADIKSSLLVDYIMSPTSCCLYLSLRYHALKPDYIYNRVKGLKSTQAFNVRILLCFVDMKDCDKLIRELTSLCLISNMTLLLAFSNDEAATYLQTFKAYENKPADSLKPQSSTKQGVKTIEAVSSIRKVNSTDAQTLLSNFESIAGIAAANEKDLGCCPGIGGLKAKNIHDLFHMPFLK